MNCSETCKQVILYAPCGGLKENALPGSGTFRRCGFVGVGVALLEEVCHGWGQALRFLMVKLCSVWHRIYFLFPPDQAVEISAPSPAPACQHIQP